MQSENSVQSPIAVSMSGQRRRLWVNNETALGECRPSDGLVLNECWPVYPRWWWKDSVLAHEEDQYTVSSG